MRVVVIGATGNIGTSVLQRLAERGAVDEIIGVARRLPGLSFPKTRFIAADIGRDDLTGVMKGAGAVVHLAWRIQPARLPRSLERTNVEGSRRVFEAAARAEVPTLVYASSVGAYSPVARDARDVPVDETHPTGGIDSALYSRQKARVEGILDRFEEERSRMRIVRIRPGLVFKREAAWGVRRNFLGPFLPRFLLTSEAIPAMPGCRGLRANAVHSLDVGEAFALAVLGGTGGEARGAFNIAAEPVLDAPLVARRLGARLISLPCGALRDALSALYRLRLEPTEPGWMDLGRSSPVMRVERARTELGWNPRVSADDALFELLDGLHRGDSLDTPPLRPQWDRSLEDLLGREEALQTSS